MYNLGIHFDGAADFIARALKEGTGVLVHCHAGISRSTSCLLAYLMKYENVGLDSGIGMCRKKRPIINPNPGFMRQLRDYERKVARNKIFEDKINKEDGSKTQRGKNRFYSTVGGADNQLEDNPY